MSLPDEITLVERLRIAADKSANGGGEWYQLIHRCREAADEIERLAREVDRLQSKNQAFRDQFRDVDELVAEWDGRTPYNPPPGWVHVDPVMTGPSFHDPATWAERRLLRLATARRRAKR